MYTRKHKTTLTIKYLSPYHGRGWICFLLLLKITNEIQINYIIILKHILELIIIDFQIEIIKIINWVASNFFLKQLLKLE